jgi:hypothetical protein
MPNSLPHQISRVMQGRLPQLSGANELPNEIGDPRCSKPSFLNTCFTNSTASFPPAPGCITGLLAPAHTDVAQAKLQKLQSHLFRKPRCTPLTPSPAPRLAALTAVPGPPWLPVAAEPGSSAARRPSAARAASASAAGACAPPPQRVGAPPAASGPPAGPRKEGLKQGLRGGVKRIYEKGPAAAGPSAGPRKEGLNQGLRGGVKRNYERGISMRSWPAPLRSHAGPGTKGLGGG